MKNYTVLKVEFYKGISDLTNTCNEAMRKYEYSNVDKNRSCLNEILCGECDFSGSYRKALQSDYYTKKDKYGRYHKDPQIKGLQILLSYSPAAEVEKNKERFEEWKKDNVKFIKNFFRYADISMVLHMDESTPHIHCMIVPINQDGKICTKSYIDSSKALAEMQTRYAVNMEKYGLERGEFNSTREDKPSVKIGTLQREVERLTAELKKIKDEQLLSDISNASLDNLIKAVDIVSEKKKNHADDKTIDDIFYSDR